MPQGTVTILNGKLLRIQERVGTGMDGRVTALIAPDAETGKAETPLDVVVPEGFPHRALAEGTAGTFFLSAGERRTLYGYHDGERLYYSPESAAAVAGIRLAKKRLLMTGMAWLVLAMAVIVAVILCSPDLFERLFGIVAGETAIMFGLFAPVISLMACSVYLFEKKPRISLFEAAFHYLGCATLVTVILAAGLRLGYIEQSGEDKPILVFACCLLPFMVVSGRTLRLLHRKRILWRSIETIMAGTVPEAWNKLDLDAL